MPLTKVPNSGLNTPQLTGIESIQSSSTTAATIFKNSTGTEIGKLCQAWVNLKGTGTVAIIGSFNVSSITDLGTGYYRINFTTAMPDTNFACVASCTTDAVTFNGWVIPSQAGTGKTANLIAITSLAATNGSGTPFAAGHPYDPVELSAAIFR